MDNIKVENYPVEKLRSSIGCCVADVFLLSSGSVMDNITLRNPNISKEQVIETAKLIGVHDFIGEIARLSYNVMERGSTLSLLIAAINFPL